MENNKLKYIPKQERKTILLLSDDIRTFSGIGTMAKEIVLGTAHHFNWVTLEALAKHPDEGKVFDLSESINKSIGIQDSSVYVIANTGYGDATKVRRILDAYNPDAIVIFTDPRYWTWLFDIEREIRSRIPLAYLNIWDNYPAPMYNRPYYESCDLLMAISKQTKNINELVLEGTTSKNLIKYVPHGINEELFYPISESSEKYSKVLEIKKSLGINDKDFILFWNSRNIHRKKPSDLILAYKEFCDFIGEDSAKRCALVMHTAAVDANGTDLTAVVDAMCDPKYVNVVITNRNYGTDEMNYLYNASDACILISSNEGWGLSLTEAMMAGKMIIANVTGGMQDQMRFEDENGKWIDFSKEFPSNNKGRYKKCGDWAVPIFPSNISLMGSVPTPYIYDDRASIDDIRNAIFKVYSTPKENRTSNGLKGREWVTSQESGMSAKMMCYNFSNSMEEVMNQFEPRSKFDLIKVEEPKSNLIPHKLYDY